jgi:hypothetical protein
VKKLALKTLGLLLIASSLLTVAPVRQAGAQPICVCHILCRVGTHCCTLPGPNGTCGDFCIANGHFCPG